MTDPVDPTRVTFLMVGCQRSGTTWVDAALREHPEVFLPAAKQSYYFDRNIERGADWYLERFAGAGPAHRAVGEVATGYSLLVAIPRMAALLPHVRLIMSMRHPVERAYSYYLTRKSEMAWPDFETALEDTDDLLARGRYAEQIEALLEHYPRERLLLLLFDELAADDRAYLGRILDFLGVDPAWESPMLGQTKNSAMFPRARRALHAVGLKPVLVAASRSPLGDAVRRLKRRSGRRGYAAMDPGTRDRLLAYYRPWNEKLEAIMGRDLQAWNE